MKFDLVIWILLTADWRDAFAPSTWSNWALVIAGFLGIIAAVWTLRTLIEQTAATKTAADAAKISAEAVINSERAWVVAELIPICRKFGGQWHRPVGTTWASMSTEETVRREHLRHKLKITNMGRTPATILSFGLGHSYLETVRTEVPHVDVVRSNEIPEFDDILGGGKSTEVIELDIHGLASNLIKEIGDSNNSVMFYGWLKYQHVFSEVDVVEAKFCYLYRPSAARLERMSIPRGGVVA